MDETRQRESTEGRSVVVGAYGDSVSDLEFSALDQAREFFGTAVRLEIVPGYEASGLASAPAGERFYARVTVRECR
jgi:hypothetical protein